MAPKITQMFRSVSGSLDDREITYLVSGVSNEQEALEACLDSVEDRLIHAPHMVMSSLEVEELSKKAFLADQKIQQGLYDVGGLPDLNVDDGLYLVTVNYVWEAQEAPGGGQPAEPTDEKPDLEDEKVRLKNYSFSQSLEQVTVFTNTVGESVYNIVDNNDIDTLAQVAVKGINPRGDNADFEGAPYRRPIGQFTILYKPLAAHADATYLKKVRNLVGTVNDAEFYGHEAGEVLFLGCDGQGMNETRMELTFNFEVRKNVTGQSITNLAGEQISYDADGHDYVWVRYAPVVDGEETKQNALAVVTEKLHPRGDLDELFVLDGTPNPGGP